MRTLCSLIGSYFATQVGVQSVCMKVVALQPKWCRVTAKQALYLYHRKVLRTSYDVKTLWGCTRIQKAAKSLTR